MDAFRSPVSIPSLRAAGALEQAVEFSFTPFWSIYFLRRDASFCSSSSLWSRRKKEASYYLLTNTDSKTKATVPSITWTLVGKNRKFC
jgi:hypothetical protein